MNLIERYCPDSTPLNHSNPMGAICRAVSKNRRIRAIGYCHNVTNVLIKFAVLLPFEPGGLYLPGGDRHIIESFPRARVSEQPGNIEQQSLLASSQGSGPNIANGKTARRKSVYPHPTMDQTTLGRSVRNLPGVIPHVFTKARWKETTSLYPL